MDVTMWETSWHHTIVSVKSGSRRYRKYKCFEDHTEVTYLNLYWIQTVFTHLPTLAMYTLITKECI